MTKNKDDVLALLSEVAGFSFSDEQINIITHENSQRLIIDACAGAGKTTIMILRILYREMMFSIDPRCTLGITFSRLAQSNMLVKYRQYKRELLKANVGLTSYEPMFKTIHAMVFELAKTHHIVSDRAVVLSEGFDELAQELSDVVYKLSTRQKYNMQTAYFAYTHWRVSGFLPNDINDVNMKQLDTVYKRAKHDNEYIDFLDMSELVMHEIEQMTDIGISIKQDMSFFDTVVIDEFQDIDDGQWRLVLNLFSVKTLENLTMIGDVDQSIYKFRGATPDIMLNEIKMSDTLKLTTNYRTRKNILDLAKKVIAPTHTSPKTLKAFNKDGETDGISIYNDSERLIRILSHLINDQQASIAVLARYNSSLHRMQDWLVSNGFSIGAIEPLDQFRFQDSYKMTIQFMQAIVTDDLTLFEQVARYVGFGALEQVVVAYRHEQFGLSFKEFLNPKTSLKDVYNECRTTEPQKKRIYNIRVSLFNQVNGKKLSIPELRKLVSNFTEKYVDFMAQKNPDKFDSLVEDFKYIKHRLSTIETPEELVSFAENEQRKWSRYAKADELNVRTMTIHQAKGLEFDDVLLMDSDTFIYKTQNPIKYQLTPEDIDEERRVMYVGMTRPKDALYLLV